MINEDLVISGISGRFAESDDVDQLTHHLFSGKDLITEDDRRWPINLYGLPNRSGKIKDLSRFDAEFFGIHPKQAQQMDPQSRILLEVTYEAIIDSGHNPKSLRGRDIGVYIGCAFNEFSEAIHSDIDTMNNFTTTGTLLSMLANRISYSFDFKGPSSVVDTACSSSLYALYQAYCDMRLGKIEMAVVGATNLNLNPKISLKFQKSGILSKVGKCQFLDSSADGYVRSESISVILLERRPTAKRIYGSLLNINVNHDGHKVQGISYPSLNSQISLMKRTLIEAKIEPDQVYFIEAHGTGTQAGDKIEAQAIEEVYGRNRSRPILVGSIKSNMGHTEGASGLCSIIKVLIAFQNRTIPANLNFSTPNPNINSLSTGIIELVVQNKELPEESVVAVNSFGLGGSNVHLLLRSEPNGNTSQMEDNPSNGNIPRLITFCGRNESTVEYIIDFFDRKSQKISNDFLTIFNEIKDNPLNGMDCRGFMLFDGSSDLTDFREVRQLSEPGRQVWFIMSGMGTQWKNMTEGFMDFPIFSESLKKSAEYLEPHGIDLIDVLNSDQMDSFIGSSIGIAAVQIALVDLLRFLHITYDGLIGHSAGELLCAYLEGLMDANQVLSATYVRAKVLLQAHLPKCQMAAVGLTWEQALQKCPSNTYPACHNSEQSVTISGLYSETFEFMDRLKKQNIFVKEVNSCGIGFHCPLLMPLKEQLIKQLDPLIPKRKRSHKWLSSSVPIDRWDSEESLYSCANYYINNLVNPVLFLQCIQQIPSNAIVIEIAPDSVFRNILRKTVGHQLSYVALMRKNNRENNLNHILSAIGQIYNLGLNPKVDKLYRKTEFPVNSGTQSISPLIKWDHTEKWSVPLYPNYFNSEPIDSTSENPLQNETPIATIGVIVNNQNHQIDQGQHSFVDKLNSILEIKNSSKVKRNKRLHEWGLDSIMVSEIKELIFAEYKCQLSSEVLTDLTYQQLIEINKINE